MQSARYAQPRPPQVTISSTSMKNRSHCIVARVLIIGLSQKCAKSCRLHLTRCNDTVAQHLPHSCRAHPERLRAVWRVLDIHTHEYAPKYASAGADSTSDSRYTQQEHIFLPCANATQVAAGRQQQLRAHHHTRRYQPQICKFIQLGAVDNKVVLREHR